MKRLFCVAACLGFGVTAFCQQSLREFNWKDLTSLPANTTLVSADGRSALKIDNTNEAPLQVALLTIDKPGITAVMYNVRGEVRYEGVKGDGYLEMWNYFPPAKPGLAEEGYFSRTLGDSGEMGKITGTSGWRPFLLPFDSTGSTGAPAKLQINLILKGRGIVYLSPLKLMQYSGAKSSGAWWSDRSAALVGSWAGGLLGCLGALIGALSSMGKGRRFVVAALKVQCFLGIGSGIAGLFALVTKQPYAVYYPLLLIGILLGSLCGGLLPGINKRYEELELRRMQSLDLAG